MENRTLSQDVPIGDHIFRLKKMDARTGTWLYSKLTAMASPEGEPVTLMQIVNAFHSCSKADFTEIQTEALKRIALVEESEGKEFESNIIAPNGTGAFSFDWLNNEVTTVYQLTDMQVVFNVSPFFPDKASSSKPPNPVDGNQ